MGSSSPAATPTPLGDTLSFFMPAYTHNLRPGETVPGTRLTYIGRSRDVYQVSIDGLTATKRTGDSFIWNGVLAPGVYANYNLRITTALFGSLPVAGPVEIIVFNPSPREEAITVENESALYYNNIVVNYLIPEGRPIPGTTLSYEGIQTVGEGDQASQLARLTGLEGYPYLAIGDSLVWSGRLLENVLIRYSLRAASLTESGLRLAGTAEMWVLLDE